MVRPSLRVTLGSTPTSAFSVGLPVLAGEAVETIFENARPAGREGVFTLFLDGEEWLLGAAQVPVAPGLGESTQALYADLFRATQGWRIARIWNYVPAINAPGADGIENYRAFCRGRSLAFERHLGADFKALVPAASAVGSKAAELSVVFAACRAPVRHVENPLQVPAYDYPHEYGPRSPSFARATMVAGRSGEGTVFVSGTAAIRGHATVGPGDTRKQLECTLENLRELSAACGLRAHFAVGHGERRHFKVYVRHPAEQPWIAGVLQERLLQADDIVSYLEADICRAALNVEIEVTLYGKTEA